VWCDRPGVRVALGRPAAAERSGVGAEQRFSGGMALWSPEVDLYHALLDDGTWIAYRAQGRYADGPPPPDVTGRVRLQGRTIHRGALVLDPLGAHAITEDDGWFGLRYGGATTVRVHHRGYLDALVPVEATLDTTVDLGLIVLHGGDVNGDNVVDILDMSYVGAQFGGADPRADLTGDGAVDILDLTLIGANFGRTGPQ
jgi:hypothetical protein